MGINIQVNCIALGFIIDSLQRAQFTNAKKNKYSSKPFVRHSAPYRSMIMLRLVVRIVCVGRQLVKRLASSNTCPRILSRQSHGFVTSHGCWQSVHYVSHTNKQGRAFVVLHKASRDNRRHLPIACHATSIHKPSTRAQRRSNDQSKRELVFVRVDRRPVEVQS